MLLVGWSLQNNREIGVSCSTIPIKKQRGLEYLVGWCLQNNKRD